MSPGPVFVVGNSRSGTTMLARMLGLHPRIHTFKELHFFEELWTPQDENNTLSRTSAVELAEHLLHNARDWYLRPFVRGVYAAPAAALVEGLDGDVRAHEVFAAVLAEEARAQGADIACEQTPRNVFYLRELLRLFPQAEVISLVRDPRDVLLSQRNWWKRRRRGSTSTPRRTSVRQWVDYHPITTSLLWRGGVRAADAFAMSPRVHVLRFEDLVRDPQSSLEPVLAALGLSFDPGMLAVPRQSSSNADNRGGSGVDPSVSGRGLEQLSAAEIWISQRVTGATAVRHGYQPTQIRPPLPGLLWCLLSWPLKTLGAFALNIGRTRNILLSLQRRLRVTST